MTTVTMPVAKTEAATDEEVLAAARAFAQALAESAEFEAFEATADRFRNDAAAQRAVAAFQSKQQSLRVMQMLNAVSAEEQAELERLRQAFLSEPAVAAYLKAQTDLTAICQAAADLLSRSIGLTFAVPAGGGCC